MKAIPQKSIAHYQILAPLGAGGMGAVYKAYDEKLHRVIALKVLQPEYISQQDRRRRFLQEARAASALNHPHILTVYEVGEEDGKPYIAMEYVEGETLRQKIKSSPLQVRETLDIAIQIAEGRAKRGLHFVYPANVYRGPESDSFTMVSRFLEPIPAAILPHASLVWW